jgi:hypothetical protein
MKEDTKYMIESLCWCVLAICASIGLKIINVAGFFAFLLILIGGAYFLIIGIMMLRKSHHSSMKLLQIRPKTASNNKLFIDCTGYLFSVSKNVVSRKRTFEQLQRFWVYLLKNTKCKCPQCVVLGKILTMMLEENIEIPLPPFENIKKGDRYRLRLSRDAYEIYEGFGLDFLYHTITCDDASMIDNFIWEYVGNKNDAKK